MEIYTDGEYIPQLVREMQKATQEIRICMYVWRQHPNNPQTPTQQLFTEILRAREKGVRVRVLTDFQDVAKDFTKCGVEAVALQARPLLHAKLFVFDSTAVGVGSHNCTQRSTTSNHEMSVISRELEPILQAQVYFDKLWETYAGRKAV